MKKIINDRGGEGKYCKFFSSFNKQIKDSILNIYSLDLDEEVVVGNWINEDKWQLITTDKIVLFQNDRVLKYKLLNIKTIASNMPEVKINIYPKLYELSKILPSESLWNKNDNDNSKYHWYIKKANR
ncbi:MAG: hypothetical protein OEZ36_10580 [Spirochaetota bacterium]|nr:hypothetical protein [Spirochaetota bacterium]